MMAAGVEAERAEIHGAAGEKVLFNLWKRLDMFPDSDLVAEGFKLATVIIRRLVWIFLGVVTKKTTLVPLFNHIEVFLVEYHLLIIVFGPNICNYIVSLYSLTFRKFVRDAELFLPKSSILFLTWSH